MKTHITAHAELVSRATELLESLADLDAESAASVAELAGEIMQTERILLLTAPPSAPEPIPATATEVAASTGPKRSLSARFLSAAKRVPVRGKK